MTRREQIIWGGIMLALLYLTAAITFAAHAVKVDEVYEPECSDIYKWDSAARYCDE